ncbi:MAG: hypothetical protein ACLTDX_00030 [[Clostridium] innocuum]
MNKEKMNYEQRLLHVTVAAGILLFRNRGHDGNLYKFTGGADGQYL